MTSSSWTQNTDKAGIYACSIMDRHIHFSMLLRTSILTIPFFLITTLPQSHCQLPPRPFYDDWICREQSHSYNCGNLSNIFYPFWGHNRPPYCGASEAFKLNCDDRHNTTTILIGSLNFTVLDISTTTYTMSMKRTDLAHDVCSPQFNDTYLSPSLFQYSPSVRNITIFYNCPSDVIISDSICGPQNNAICQVGAKDELLKIDPELKRCERHIQVAAGFPLEPYGSGVIDRDDLERGLSEGFQVNYCVECPGSKGDCWRRDIDSHVKLSCYHCPDGTTASLCFVPSVLNTPIKISSPSLSPSPLPSPSPSASTSPAPLPPPVPTNALFHRPPSPNFSGNKWNRKWKLIIGVIGAAIAGLLICITIYHFRYKSLTWQMHFGLMTKKNQHIEAFLRNHGALTLKRYKLSDVKKMTKNFKVKLGQGGFGVVYKGTLPNGCPVAVKILNASKRNDEEFINEVASISRTSHVNVVALLGLCLEGSKKALIYEFMHNGSLDNFIYNKEPKTITSLSWNNLYKIASGIARGLEYLHRGCNTRILHFDIKPHNILLDENFCPKISDFGLAKLCPRKESIISMSDARGTMGYVAPEVWNRHFGGVSHKSDVYSYGMMLLEMVGGRKNINAEANHTSEIFFPHWVYNRLELGSDLRPDGVISTEENEIARRMTIVGLWCIQTIPNDRPTMSRVIEMLEDNTKSVEIPPKPMLSSPTRSISESSTS